MNLLLMNPLMMNLPMMNLLMMNPPTVLPLVEKMVTLLLQLILLCLTIQKPIQNFLLHHHQKRFLWLWQILWKELVYPPVVLKEATATASHKHPTKVCKVCYAQGKPTTSGLPLRTSYVCGDCPSQPALHVEYQGQYCFKIYHTKLWN